MIYSFSDLIKLVLTINADVQRFSKANNIDFEPFTGVCNHWAGNSIYHQHYQFFRGLPLPVLYGNPDHLLLKSNGVVVRKIGAELPLYEITLEDSDDLKTLMYIADQLARIWAELDNRKEVFTNGIVINNQTQNLVVTVTTEGKLQAYFVPRVRNKLNANATKKLGAKMNLAVMEALGYFIVDNPEDFIKIQNMPSKARKELAVAWRGDICPDNALIGRFDEALISKLQPQHLAYAHTLSTLASTTNLHGIRSQMLEIITLVSAIRADLILTQTQTMELLISADHAYLKLRHEERRLAGETNVDETTVTNNNLLTSEQIEAYSKRSI